MAAPISTTTGLQFPGAVVAQTAPTAIQNLQWTIAAGTADAITGAYPVPNVALTDGLVLGFRASAANLTTTPTFSPDGLPPHTITKDGGVALVPGDIPGEYAECFVRYNLAFSRWELMNPAVSSGTVYWTTPQAYGSIPDGGENGPASGTDNIATTQAALTAIAARGGGVLVFPPAQYAYRYKLQAGSPYAPPVLTVGSNTTIMICAGATIWSEQIFGGFNSGLLCATSGHDITITGDGLFTAAPGITFTGTTHSGTMTVDTIANISALGLRKNMPINGPGIPPGQALISSINTAAGSITLNVNCTLTGASALTAQYTGSPFIYMTGVDRVSIDGPTFGDAWGVLGFITQKIGFAGTNFRLANLKSGYSPSRLAMGARYFNEDFIDIVAPSSFGILENLKGISGDDFIAVKVENYLGSNWDSGIHHIAISDVEGISEWAQIVRLYVQIGSVAGSIFDIDIANVGGTPCNLGVNSTTAGVHLQDLSNRLAIYDVHVTNASIDANNSTWAFYCQNVRDIYFKNITGRVPVQNYFYATSCVDVSVDGYIFNGAAQTSGYDSVYITGCSYTSLKNGLVGAAAGDGLHIVNSQYGEIAGSTFYGNGAYGVALDGSEDWDVHDNLGVVNTNAFLQEQNGADYNSAHHNNVRNNGGGTIALIGAHSRAADNPGYNPVSTGSVSSPTTGGTYTAGHSPETLYLSASGGITTLTVGGISIIPTSLGNNAVFTVQLNPNDVVVPTYSGTLTIQRMIH